MRVLMLLVLLALLSCTKKTAPPFQLIQTYQQNSKVYLVYNAQLDPLHLPSADAYNLRIHTLWQDIDVAVYVSIMADRVVLDAGTDLSGYSLFVDYDSTQPKAIRNTSGVLAGSIVNRPIQ